MADSKRLSEYIQAIKGGIQRASLKDEKRDHSEDIASAFGQERITQRNWFELEMDPVISQKKPGFVASN